MQPDIDRDPADRQRARQRRAEQIQRRRMALGICVLALLVVVLILIITCSGEDGAGATSTTGGSTDVSLPSAVYTAELTGAESVPSVTTTAKATLTLNYDSETEQLAFDLEVTKALSNPSSATIYEGTAGSDGQAVCVLFAGPTKVGSHIGGLADGVIVDADLTGSLLGQTIADLIALFESGNAYVSIGNTSHPVDAIRGQIGRQGTGQTID